MAGMGKIGDMISATYTASHSRELQLTSRHRRVNYSSTKMTRVNTTLGKRDHPGRRWTLPESRLLVASFRMFAVLSLFFAPAFIETADKAAFVTCVCQFFG